MIPAGELGEPGEIGPPATILLERAIEDGPDVPVSGREAFEVAHIPGAPFADVLGDLADPAPAFPFALPSRQRFAAALGALGVGPGTHVIAYAQDSPMWATRLWWLLPSFGFDDVSVLDGGLPAWRASGLPLSDVPSAYPRATFAARTRAELLATRDDVERVVAGAPACLVNALGERVVRGEGPTSYSPDRGAFPAA